LAVAMAKQVGVLKALRQATIRMTQILVFMVQQEAGMVSEFGVMLPVAESLEKLATALA
jgi:hypothetical protein